MLHHLWSQWSPWLFPGIWGESACTNVWKDSMWKKERTRSCAWRASAIVIVNTSSVQKSFLSHTSSLLPVVYLDPSKIPSNSLFVSFSITFKSRCWAPPRLLGVCGGEYEYPRGDKWVCLCLYENVALTSPEGEELYYRVMKNQNLKTSEGLCIPARFEQNGFKQIFWCRSLIDCTARNVPSLSIKTDSVSI